VELPKRVWNNGSGYQDLYEDGWEIEMIKIIGNSLNMSLDIEASDKYRTSPPAIYVGGYKTFPSKKTVLIESSRNYLTVYLAWYTPCAVKYQRWTSFFNIFSVHMWINFTLALVLAVITIRFISNYSHKLHLQESKSFNNVFAVTSTVISVVLSVSVNTQPRSAPLRLFFFCWVWYSVAISTVFQSYLTTFLIEPGYMEPIKTVEQMLASDKKFGLVQSYEKFFNDSSESTDSTILKKAVRCPDYNTCLNWTIVYHNISTILDDFTKLLMNADGNWTDENNRPIACELEYGGVETSGVSFWVSKGSHLLVFINDIIGRVVEGGIFVQISNLGLYKAKLKSKFHSPTFDDTYYAISVSHLQTVFYLLLLGYLLAFACVVTEKLRHFYRSKWRGLTGTSLRQLTDINRHTREH
jgi:hypothetical protein